MICFSVFQRASKLRTCILVALISLTVNVLAEPDKPVSAIGAKRLEALQKASTEGSVTAMVQLAGIYLAGASGERKPDLAAELYRRAAALGDADATFHLGNMYLIGDGIGADEDEAYRLFEQAAGQGHPLALQNYESLQRSRAAAAAPQETPSSLKELAAPATLDEIAAVQLARRHNVRIDFNGTRDPTSMNQRVMPESRQESRMEPNKPLKVTERKDVEASFREAEKLYLGDGIAKDEAKAITLYRRAARAGHGPSITRLLAIYAAAGIEPPRCGDSGVADEICF